ncbi:MAG: adenylate/guanylate cyclase domain-containing protein [Actinobacteria bacterium]|nr:MAG: adenylate/guanylate cyclase domain-containing protein [Actinomycetota bacterium]
MSPPKTSYAKSGDVNIAYQVLGEGPIDLVYVWGWLSHLDFQWMNPTLTSFLLRLAGFSRLIMFDKRGSGLSDPVGEAPTFEERMDDIRAVMDAVGSERAALLGFSEGCAMSAMFAASHPERTIGLILYDGFAVGINVEGASPEMTWSEQALNIRRTIDHWGEGETLRWIAPSMAGTPGAKRLWGTFERASMSPGMALSLWEAIQRVDARPVLPLVRVPTLVLHHRDSPIPAAGGRAMAELVPGARYVELPGRDHFPGAGDPEAVAGEIQEFLTGARVEERPDRVLATVLFTDIVDSTRRAAELGDRAWRALLDRHDALVRAQLELFCGREVKHTGDGFLASFDGPARAIRCASAVVEEARELGVELRAGLHAGECELRGDDLGGIAVHVAARVGALAPSGGVLVSGTVKDLVMGSGIELLDRGVHELKGVPGQWRLFALGEHDGGRSLGATSQLAR